MRIIRLLKLLGRLEMTILLGAMGIFCFALSLVRFKFCHSPFSFFLNWNLFLAFIPWFVSSAVMIYPNLQKRWYATLSAFVVWMLFFPNSPYILTDLFHLRQRPGVPLWFDLILILSFAWTGLVFGLVSLFDLEHFLATKFNRWISSIVPTILLFVSGFGVYIGRYLRWNSWDVVQDPVPLFYDIASRFHHPTHHPKTWGVTILMGIFLNMIYWSVKLIREKSMRTI